MQVARHPKQPLVGHSSCVSLVGMAGAGKSTLAPILARRLGWMYMDTDRLMEARFGAPLQEVLDTYGREEFLTCEERIVGRIGAARMVVSTGGSVVYSNRAVERLKLLGPVVHLRITLATFLARVGSAESRGFVRPAGMSLEEVFLERRPLYENAADLSVDTDDVPPEECAERIAAWMGC